MPKTKIKDQCNTSSCWVMTYLTRVEERFKMKGETIELSAVYFVLQSLRWKAQYALDHFADNPQIEEAEWSTWAPHIAREFGAIPAKNWRPKLKLIDWPIVRMVKKIN